MIPVDPSERETPKMSKFKPKKTPVPGTACRRAMSIEHEDWKGRSHRRGGKLIRNLRAADHLKAEKENI